MILKIGPTVGNSYTVPGFRIEHIGSHKFRATHPAFGELSAVGHSKKSACEKLCTLHWERACLERDIKCGLVKP